MNQCPRPRFRVGALRNLEFRQEDEEKVAWGSNRLSGAGHRANVEGFTIEFLRDGNRSLKPAIPPVIPQAWPDCTGW